MNSISPQEEMVNSITSEASLAFFFFSSRRRHTILQGDWSSDVCSSDLGQRGEKPGEIVYDLGARYPVEALRLLPADRNAVIPVRFEIEEGGNKGARPTVDRKSVV